MASSLACPKCQARLKINKLPTEERKLQCPQCGHKFTLSPTSVTAQAPSAPRAPVRAPLSHRFIAAALVASFLIVAALSLVTYFAFRSGPVAEVTTAQKSPEKEAEPKEPERIQEKKEEKKIEQPKEEPKKTDKKEDAKQRGEFTRLLVKAVRDAEGKRYDTAIASFNEALKLFPDDEEAKRGLLEAQAAQAEFNKTRLENEKLQTELALLLKQGNDSLEKKQYAAASEFFKLALQKVPADAEAAKGLTAAQQALANDLIQQKKQAEFDGYINAGRAHLKAGRYADAVREFVGAQGVLPGSPLAISLQRQAEEELTRLKGAEERQKEYTRLMEQGVTALRNQRFEDAETLFRQVLKIAPNEPQAEKALAEAQRLSKLVREDFRKLMTLGSQALRDMRFLDAVTAFREANRLVPSDPVAPKALADAQLALDRANNYDQAMKRAGNAMMLQRYNDAIVAFNEALKAAPNDPFALQGLQEASRIQQEFDFKIQQATLALNQQKYADASKLLQDAIKLQPNHAQIFVLQKQARFTDFMAKGQTAMAAQNYKEAVRQFQSALMEIPSDPVAQASFARARTMVK